MCFPIILSDKNLFIVDDYYDIDYDIAAFNKSLQGKISELIEGNSGVYAIRVESNAAKVATLDESGIKQTLLQAARMSAFRGLDALKKSASITDNRSKFY